MKRPQVKCQKCGVVVPNSAFCCPSCGEPVDDSAVVDTSKQISSRGMLLMILVFIVFPVVLFLLHIFIPGL